MPTLTIKRALVGSSVGRAAAEVRELVRCTAALWTEPEKASAASQDRCFQRLLPRLCPAGGVFVDVGSHIGSVISAVLRHTPHATIIAIEATPEKAVSLRRRFPSVTVHDCAVGPAEGDVRFYLDRKRPGFNSLDARDGREQIVVPMRVLDSLVVRADVVKIDVEGGELGVLRGSEKLIESSRPSILFESAGGGVRLGYSLADMWEWFDSHRYEVLVPNRVAHEGKGLTKDAWLDAHVYPRRTTNYVAVPREKRIEVRDRARKIMGVVVPQAAASPPSAVPVGAS